MQDEKLKNSFIINEKTLNEIAKIDLACLGLYSRMLADQEHNGLYVGNQKDLAKKVNLSIKTLNKYLKILKDNGYIDITRQGQTKGTIYIVHMQRKGA